MHEPRCYLCGSDSRRTLFAQSMDDPYLALAFDRPPSEPLNWVVCRECGFVYRTPALDAGELETLYARYEEDVFKNTDPDAYFDRIVSLPRDRSENWGKVDWLAGALEGLGAAARPSVLDIGCGGGTLLHTLGERMPLGPVCGVELNPAYAELASRRLCADVRNEAYACGLFGRSFDLLVCTKVLEHVPDPLPFLAEMGRDLSEGGFLFLEVPDVSDLLHLPPDNPRFYIPHIHFFSAATLGALLVRAGFAVRETRVSVTHRGRAYLQVLAVRGVGEEPAAPPYDDPELLVRGVAENLARHGVGRNGNH